MNKETISMLDVIEAINESSTKIQQQIDGLRQEINERFNVVYERLDYHETWLNRIEKNMAVKNQFNSLLNILTKKEVISSYEANHITEARLI